MAQEQLTSEDAEQGVFITGEYLKSGLGRKWTTSSGEERQPGTVHILIGERVYQIEYRTLDEAREAIKDAARGDVVTVAVYPRVVGPRAHASECRVGYNGRLLDND